MKYVSRFHPENIEQYIKNIESILPDCEGKTEQECIVLAKQVIPPEAVEFSSLFMAQASKTVFGAGRWGKSFTDVQ